MASIELVNVSKYFGKFKALENVSFRYEDSGAIGYLGPNGAGKTTTLKILTNLLRPSSGKAMINGIDVNRNPVEAFKSMGSVIESPSPFPYFTVEDSLMFVAELRRMNRKDARDKIEYYSKALALPDLDKRIGDLSKGQRQRVVIASALLPDPQVLLLDEPTSGLDPFEMKIIRDLIVKLKEDRLVLMSSHLLSEVSEVCDEVIFINHGRILAKDKVSNISREFRTKAVVVEFLDQVDERTISAIKAIGLDPQINGRNSVVIPYDGSNEERAEILQKLVGVGKIIRYDSVGSGLEEAYISILKNGGDQ
ncbi:ABC transporter ATP-binding protein [Thermoplasma sp.]|uniref:ABC transporter ATP-binding protein n=1 Tax=Thermoplasma sp. TaxID=1973142 RepID=UPI00128A1402|nr:ABC transporter ATP-binding protein [Thermoplasma sp.]KAA8922334.1 MAG: ABC transporter ATP-binding protein [Thermoplasma sp.]